MAASTCRCHNSMVGIELTDSCRLKQRKTADLMLSSSCCMDGQTERQVKLLLLLLVNLLRSQNTALADAAVAVESTG